jgi:hypothetical protein
MLLDGSTIVDLVNAVSLTQTLLQSVALVIQVTIWHYRYLLADMPQIKYPPLAYKIKYNLANYMLDDVLVPF